MSPGSQSNWIHCSPWTQHQTSQTNNKITIKTRYLISIVILTRYFFRLRQEMIHKSKPRRSSMHCPYLLPCQENPSLCITALRALSPPSSATAPKIASMVSYIVRGGIEPRELGFKLINLCSPCKLHIRCKLLLETWLWRMLSATAANSKLESFVEVPWGPIASYLWDDE